MQQGFSPSCRSSFGGMACSNPGGMPVALSSQGLCQGGPCKPCIRGKSYSDRIARMADKKLDIFPHIFPLEYFERMKQIAEGNAALAAALKRWMHIPVLWDLERRIRM